MESEGCTVASRCALIDVPQGQQMNELIEDMHRRGDLRYSELVDAGAEEAAGGGGDGGGGASGSGRRGRGGGRARRTARREVWLTPRSPAPQS